MRSLADVDPAPPPITIVDPNAPPGSQEVLGSDGGWRPSAYQKGLALLTAAIVALLVTGVQRVRHVHHESALDAAARAGVALEVVADQNGDEAFQLYSTSSGSVTVLSVTLVGDGYREQREDVTIAPRGYGSVSASQAKNCTTSLFDSGPTEVRVKLRTSRGDVLTRTVPLAGDVAQAVQAAERWKCDYLTPGESTGAQVVSARREGRDVVTVWAVQSFGKFPVTILDVTAPDGMTATASLPVTLGRAAFWTGHSKPVQLTIRMRITDCKVFAAGFSSGFGGGAAPGDLAVTLKHDYASDVVSWGFALQGFTLDAEGPGASGDPSQPSEALTLLESGCDPSLFTTFVPY